MDSKGLEMVNAQKRRGVSIYLAANAQQKGADSRLSEEQQMALSLVEEPMRLGVESQVLVEYAEGFTLKHLWLKPNFPLPRHHHTPGDCMYYVISGRARMGNRELSAGDSFLVPSDAPYQYTAGPQGVEVLEIRYGCPVVDMTIVEDHERYQQRANEALEKNRQVWTEATIAPTFAAKP